MTGTEVRCVWPAGALLGEGPLWSPRDAAVWFVDIRGSRLLRWDPADGGQGGGHGGGQGGGRREWPMDEACCWLVERADGDGFLAGLRSRFVHLRLDGGRPVIAAEIARPEADLPGNRFNDAKADAWGRVWAGSMDDAGAAPTGSLYRIDADGTVTRADGPYTVANGPATSPDGRTLYHTDSAARTVYAFDLGADGVLSRKRVHIRFGDADGYPDGMTCDAEGGLWIAHWDGGRVSRFHPDGSLDRAVALPVSRVTSCVFGGPGLDRLFVTTAAFERAHEPLAGGLFEIDPGVRGPAPAMFAGPGA